MTASRKAAIAMALSLSHLTAFAIGIELVREAYERRIEAMAVIRRPVPDIATRAALVLTCPPTKHAFTEWARTCRQQKRSEAISPKEPQ